MKFLTFFTLLFLSASLFGQNRDLSSENIVSKQTQAKEAFLKTHGGFVVNKKSGKGFIAVIDAQKVVIADKLKYHVSRIENALMTSVRYFTSSQAVDFVNLNTVIAEARGNLSVIVTENDNFPACISLPENKCAIINVRALALDGADSKTIQDRVFKEIARGICMALQLPYSGASGSIMVPVFSISDLDKILVDNLGLSEKMLVDRTTREHFGMKHFQRSTYLKACEEGWAPEPRNEYQKAIWDKVHSMPANPMKIEFDPKKGR